MSTHARPLPRTPPKPAPRLCRYAAAAYPRKPPRRAALAVLPAAVAAALLVTSALRLRRAPPHAAWERRVRRAAVSRLGPDGLSSPPPPLRLPLPPECVDWRRRARHPESLSLYRAHFTSHDLTDWFVYTSFFTELWHASLKRGFRPRYLDIAANHARRWSATWFLDRCMGWRGVCVEANPKYWHELSRERSCRLVKNCVSDKRRTVVFSLTDAYGGVVARHGVGGVNATLHRSTKFARQHAGLRNMTCDRTAAVARGDFDFLSLDVEGHELSVLQGVDWSTTRFGVIVTENRSPGVRELLAAKRYTLHEGVLKDDIWIRDGSGFAIDQSVRDWLRHFDRRTYTFRPGLSTADTEEQGGDDDEDGDVSSLSTR